MQYLIHGGDIYSYEKKYNKKPLDFSSNINPLGMPFCVKQAVSENIKCLEFYPDILYRDLKKAVSEKEKIDERYIFCTNGASEALFLISAALKPKKALIPVPTFLEYEKSLFPYNTEIVYYSLCEKNGFCIKEDFINFIDKSIDIIYLCNPNNPTGNIIENSVLEKIILKADLCGCYIMIDESFIDFSEKELSAKRYLDKYKNLIILKSYTKIYAMAGVRTGFIFSSNKILLDKISEYTPDWNVSTLACLCVINAVKDIKYIDKSISYIKKERERLKSCLIKADFKVFNSEVNYIFFKNISIENLKLKFEEKGILIRCCGNYNNLDDNYFRIAVRTKEENILFINALGELKP